MPEIQKRDDVEDQYYEDNRKERDGAKPREHERALAGPGRRLGNADNIVESSEKLCQQFDHGCLRPGWANRSRRLLFSRVDEQSPIEGTSFYRECNAASSIRAATSFGLDR